MWKARGMTKGEARVKTETFLRLAQRRFGEIPETRAEQVRIVPIATVDHWLDALIPADYWLPRTASDFAPLSVDPRIWSIPKAAARRGQSIPEQALPATLSVRHKGTASKPKPAAFAVGSRDPH